MTRKCPVCKDKTTPTGQLDGSDYLQACHRGHIWNPFTGEVLRGAG